MAAITPFLENQAEEYGSVAVDLGRCEPPKESAKKRTATKKGLDDPVTQFAEQTRLVYTRYAVSEVLGGKTFHIEQDGREFHVVLDDPIEVTDIPLASFPQAQRRSSLLTWTKKMGTLSWSLPAGSPLIGGSCPGATAAQSIVPIRERKNSIEQVKKTLAMAVDPRAAICASCYATGGNYQLGTTQFKQLMLFAWAKAALEEPAGSPDHFVTVMSEAVRLANYHQGEYKFDAKTCYEPERAREVVLGGQRREIRAYFRIHDSGDFFSIPYYDAWVEIAKNNPDIVFWAPTRVWVLPEFRDHVKRHGTWNLVVRPSGYHVDDPTPRLGFKDAGTTSILVEHDQGMAPEREAVLPEGAQKPAGSDDRYDWRCQTYAVLSEAHSCRHAVSPSGEVGCRACWVHPELEVNYSFH